MIALAIKGLPIKDLTESASVPSGLRLHRTPCRGTAAHSGWLLISLTELRLHGTYEGKKLGAKARQEKKSRPVPCLAACTTAWLCNYSAQTSSDDRES